jgi:hypothetical protein
MWLHAHDLGIRVIGGTSASVGSPKSRGRPAEAGCG